MDSYTKTYQLTSIERLTSKAKSMAKDDQYKAVGNQTQCNKYTADLVAHMVGWKPPELFNNDQPRQANEMFQILSQTTAGGGNRDWHDVTHFAGTHAADLNTMFAASQKFADRGFVVVIAWSNPAGQGHVAVVVPSPTGELAASKKWTDKQNVSGVPYIAQAGATVMAEMPLSQGFGADRTYLDYPTQNTIKPRIGAYIYSPTDEDGNKGLPTFRTYQMILGK